MTSASGHDALDRGYRSIRQLTPPAVPWPATLTRTTDGASCVRVDSHLLADWPGWSAPATGHVLGPLDVVRTEAGHDVVLPVCTERVSALLERRERTTPLSPGERVTIAVSLLRGLAALAEPDIESGCWWLTDDGRPVFVHLSEADTAVAETTALLRGLAGVADTAVAPALDAAAALADDPRALAHALVDVEDALFQRALPEALATTPLLSASPRSADDAAPGGTPSTGADADTPWQRWAALMDADLADAVSRATTSLWRRLHSRRPAGRTRPWLVAGGLAAVVIAVGVLWPAGTESPAVAEGTAQPVVATGSVPTTDPTDPPAAASTDTPPATDPVAITGRLLDARTACLAETHENCLSDVMEDPTREIAKGAVDLPDGERRIMLLDEFGGAAVLRLESTAGDRPAQLLVIVETAGKWLLRDVHDVAEQPGG